MDRTLKGQRNVSCTGSCYYSKCSSHLTFLRTIQTTRKGVSMKFFHTADWHIGKLINGVYMTNDQRHILDLFVQAVEAERPDAVIIAGDLYDRAVPSPEAVELLDDIIERIVLKLNVPVLAISGNHDSPERLDFGTSLMQSVGLHMVGKFTDELAPVMLQDEHGPVHFHLIPFADPALVRSVYQDDTIRSHDDAMRAITTRIQASMDQEARHVFVGHAFVTPSGEKENNTSDSERVLSVGGAEHVSSLHFESFHYTALGHLHQAHHVRKETIRYAGSPLKYSISEEKHAKGYTIVHLAGDGQVTYECRTLQPLRDMRTVEATMAELLRQPRNEDYVYVRLQDEQLVLSAMDKVRTVFPNAMDVRQEQAIRNLVGHSTEVEGRAKMNPQQLFQSFYEEVNEQKVKPESLALFQQAWDAVTGGEV